MIQLYFTQIDYTHLDKCDKCVYGCGGIFMVYAIIGRRIEVCISVPFPFETSILLSAVLYLILVM